jgi:type II secretory pathway pseudopilin PulG
MKDERGMTLIEVTVAGALSTIIAAAMITMFISLNGNVALQESRANATTEAGTAVSELVVELRQAVDLDGDGFVVASLDGDWSSLDLQFAADRYAGDPGPEWYRYRLDNCSGGLCDLVRDRTVADTGSGPNWTFSSDPMSNVVAQNVIVDGVDHLFEGVSWSTGSEETVDFCGDAFHACEFLMVRIRLRVEPDRLDTGVEPVEVVEDVRLRNG